VLLGAVIPTAFVLYSRGASGYTLAFAAWVLSGFVASAPFTARAWPWALILGAAPLFLTRGPVPSMAPLALLTGAGWGNVITLRRRGLIATR
jgi:hypothetical protein